MALRQDVGRWRPGRILAFGSLATLITPPAVFVSAALSSGLTPGQTLAALAAQVVAPRHNLLVTAAIGLFPLALLAATLWAHRRLAPRNLDRQALALAGLLPILAVGVWTHQDFWPLFLPARTYPGFPHGLGFIIGPMIFAPAGMAIAMLTVWLSRRLGIA